MHDNRFVLRHLGGFKTQGYSLAKTGRVALFTNNVIF